MTDPIKVAVAGAAGRMGRTLVTGVAAHDRLHLAAAIERPGAPEAGEDAGRLAGVGDLGVPIAEDIHALTGTFEVLIDFTIPSAALTHVAACANAGRAVVIGTTGFDAAGLATIREAASASPHPPLPQHERRRQRHLHARRTSRPHPGRRGGCGSLRSPPPPQDRRPFRHRRPHGRNPRQGPEPRPDQRCHLRPRRRNR